MLHGCHGVNRKETRNKFSNLPSWWPVEFLVLAHLENEISPRVQDSKAAISRELEKEKRR